MRKLAYAFSGFALGIALSANAGSLGITSIAPWMDWKTKCSRPYTPSFSVYDVDSYNHAVDEFNDFVAEARSFLSCVKSDAEGDIRTTAQVIAESADKIRSEIVLKVETTKADLQSKRYLID